MGLWELVEVMPCVTVILLEEMQFGQDRDETFMIRRNVAMRL